jgi:TRAP-type C4-dicarboxylate transport system permease small subunit
MSAAYVRFIAALMKCVRVIIGLLLIAGVLLNLANVFGRYVLHAPIVGAEEVMVFLMVGIVFLGFSSVMWEGRHIRMDVAVQALPARFRRALEFLVAAVSIATGALIIELALPVVVRLAMFDERSQAANVPLAIPQATIPAGCFLMLLVVVARLLDPVAAKGEGSGGGHA